LAREEQVESFLAMAAWDGIIFEEARPLGLEGVPLRFQN
jgi:hypothetical protein